MEERFLKAYDDYADALYRHAVFHVRDKEGAKDLVQETFTRTWDHIAKGGAIENIRAFLYRTIKNLIIDGYRKKTTDSLDALMEAGFEAPFGEVGGEFREAEMREAVGAMAKLKPDDRDLLLLRYVEGLEPKDIAQIERASVNAISVRINRATAKLRDILINSSSVTT